MLAKSLIVLESLETVKDTRRVIVAGLGEVGKPLFDLPSKEYDVIGVDISATERIEQGLS